MKLVHDLEGCDDDYDDDDYDDDGEYSDLADSGDGVQCKTLDELAEEVRLTASRNCAVVFFF